MARFKREPKAYRLKFEGEFDGLEVTMRSLPVEQFLSVSETALAARDGNDSGIQAAGEMVRAIAGALVEWNLDDEDGQPIPATYEGLCSQDIDLVLAISRAWMTAMGGVEPPLPDGSSDGATSLEPSIPMDIQSPSPPS